MTNNGDSVDLFPEKWFIPSIMFERERLKTNLSKEHPIEQYVRNSHHTSFLIQSVISLFYDIEKLKEKKSVL